MSDRSIDAEEARVDKIMTASRKVRASAQKVRLSAEDIIKRADARLAR